MSSSSFSCSMFSVLIGSGRCARATGGCRQRDKPRGCNPFTHKEKAAQAVCAEEQTDARTRRPKLVGISEKNLEDSSFSSALERLGARRAACERASERAANVSAVCCVAECRAHLDLLEDLLALLDLRLGELRSGQASTVGFQRRQTLADSKATRCSSTRVRPDGQRCGENPQRPRRGTVARGGS